MLFLRHRTSCDCPSQLTGDHGHETRHSNRHAGTCGCSCTCVRGTRSYSGGSSRTTCSDRARRIQPGPQRHSLSAIHSAGRSAPELVRVDGPGRHNRLRSRTIRRQQLGTCPHDTRPVSLDLSAPLTASSRCRLSSGRRSVAVRTKLFATVSMRGESSSAPARQRQRNNGGI